MLTPEQKRILKVIPHGPKILMLDEVLTTNDGGGHAVGIRLITEKDCEDHFGILPGFKMFEMVGQLGTYWLLTRTNKPKHSVMFQAIEKAEFLRLCVPGDRVRILVWADEKVKNLAHGEICRDGGREDGKPIITFSFAYTDPIPRDSLNRLIEVSKRRQQPVRFVAPAAVTP